MKITALTLICCVITFFTATAQVTGTRTLSGVVIDSANQKPIAFASVLLREAGSNAIVKSTVTTDKGFFQLAAALSAEKTYTLELSYVGYQHKIIDIPAGKQAGDMGNISLAAMNSQINNVTVVGSKPLVKQEIDRLTYDVQADPLSKGQTAMDMLRRVPLVTVDGDDNIQLQGSGSFRIFINGKPSALVTSNPKDVLRAMPANVIQRIEIITTPPAKYDSEGLAGIINIITVKKTDDGYNGTVSLRDNVPFGPGININGTAKQRTFGVSLFSGGSLRSAVTTLQENERKTYGASPDLLSQRAWSTNDGAYLYSGIEVSKEFDSLHLLTTAFNYAAGKSDQDYNRSSDYYIGTSNMLLQSYNLFNNGGNSFRNMDLGLNYQLGFAQKKEQLLTASYRYSYSLNKQYSNNTIISHYQYDAPDNNQRNDAGFKEHTFQLDYVHPVKALTIEAGAKTILRNNYSNSAGQVYISPAAGFVDDPTVSNNFNYHQDIYSIYNSYLLKLKNWTIQGGVRAEYTKVNADFTSTSTTLDMHYLNVVPTISILKKLKNNNTLTLGITNRLMRPGIQQLNPYIDKTNPQLVSTGNPFLKPVISHLFELSYNRVGKGSLNTRLSYMYTNNSIENVTKVIADTLSETSFDNVGQSKILRVNLNGNYPLSPKWSINFNSAIFYVWITGTYNGRFYSNQGPRTNTFVSTTYKFNKGWQLSLSGGYNRRYINLQGSSNDYYYSIVGVTKTVKNFTFTAVVNNLTMSHYRFTVYNDTPDFYQSNTSNFIYRNLNLNISYKFGKLNAAIKKNKRGINNDDVSSGSSN